MSRDVVEAPNERAGCRLVLVGVVEQGQSGAAYVRWPDGRESVVTTAFASLSLMRLTAAVLTKARREGIPVPLHEFLFDLGDGTVAVVQERLPGSTAAAADVPVVDAIVAVNERFAGLLADRIPAGEISAHSPRAGRLVAAIRRTASDSGPDLVGDDLVHVDLTVPNVLFSAGRTITGVIDWNYGVARGD